MKRSQINQAIRAASACFSRHGWTLPPNPKWDVTDMGLGRFDEYGLVLVNLAEEDEYCEKLMYARRNQRTPAHTHRMKKEDIIARNGVLVVQVWQGLPGEAKAGEVFELKVNGEARRVASGEMVRLNSGERVTLVPGIYHEFWPETDECVIGEVSTKNDDAHDNFFVDPNIGRFPEVEEDEPPLVKLVSDPT
jgi:D-lyxose ketol-isomerase